MTRIMVGPRPHFLIEGEVSEVGNEVVFRGAASFPFSDVSVGDRRDHVNASHFLFAIWNAAHLMLAQTQSKVRNVRITHLSGDYFSQVVPEEVVQLEVRTHYQPAEFRHSKLGLEEAPAVQVRGEFTATFSRQREDLAKIQGQFVGWG